MNLFTALHDDYCIYKPNDLYVRTFFPDFLMERHHHEQIEIMYAKSRMFNVHIFDKGGNKKTEHIFEGQFIVINSNVEHYIDCPVTAKILNFEFLLTRDNFRSASFLLSPVLRRQKNYIDFCNGAASYSIINADIAFTSLLSLLLSATMNGYEDNYDYVQALLLAILIEVGNSYKNTQTNVCSYYTNIIVNMINSSFADPFSIAELATQLNISKSYLHRCFRKDMGVSIIEYLNKRRIDHAKKLLITTNHSVIDISTECGFNNRQSFSYAFRKETGISPSEYKETEANREFITWLHPANKGKLELQQIAPTIDHAVRNA